jgi:hypothetical protein
VSAAASWAAQSEREESVSTFPPLLLAATSDVLSLLPLLLYCNSAEAVMSPELVTEQLQTTLSPFPLCSVHSAATPWKVDILAEVIAAIPPTVPSALQPSELVRVQFSCSGRRLH